MYRSLVALVRGSQWAKLGTLVVGIAVPIAANHGILPPGTALIVGAPLPPQPEKVEGGETGGTDAGRAPEAVAGPAP
jgi:hypothetical protein